MTQSVTPDTLEQVTEARTQHAQAIARAGGIDEALAQGSLPDHIDTTLSEGIILGLLRQGVRVFFTVFGHGSTEIGEILRIYQEAGLVRTCGVRSEIEASHAATALRWTTGEKVAVITSIGPGALHALAASLVPASDGIGVWYLFGDETTEDEGPNMQQIPKHEQHPFLQLCSVMGRAYVLHTPGSLSTALRRGMATVDHPHRQGPFFLLMPMNTQPALLPGFCVDELPCGAPPRLGAAAGAGAYGRAADALLAAERVVVKVGGGAINAGGELAELLELIDGVAVHTPIASGVIPYSNRRNMSVGGSKGSLCGNYAMENADLLLAVGTRFVCQSDSSRTGYPLVETVININADLDAAIHYARATALVGDAAPTLRRLIEALRERGATATSARSPWLTACDEKRAAWEAFKAERYATPTLTDGAWDQEILTQPAAIKAALDWATEHNAVCFFDAGDVQANGFQIAEDECVGRTITESGASYMGFAVSALLATAVTDELPYALAFSGDGSFTMNPQILIDGVEHGARGCILLFDNRRMGAISGLQYDQYGAEHATADSVEVDYVAWARAVKGVQAYDGGTAPESLVAALDRALAHDGLSLIHVPVYFGPDPLGGMGVFGRWNVGNWCQDTQALRHKIGL